MTSCIGYKIAESHFSQPLPWIGLYIAGASLLCGLAMGADAHRVFSKHRVWFPPKYFALNSLTLTLLGVATKLPVDLNTTMPGSWDQLTKLSGTVLTCTLMANFIHSLGSMSNSDIISNVIALAILVITIIVNMIMQMCTGVIYVFLPEHVTIMVIMLVLLVLVASSALIVPTTKKILNNKYRERCCEIQKNKDKSDKYSTKKLKEYIRKLRLMSQTSNPQFVIGRSPTCMASGALCLASTLIFIEAIVRRFFVMKSAFCGGESDYRWSIVVVLIAQAFAVVVGTVLPVVRWFCAIKLKHPELLSSSTCKDVFKVERYWIEMLKEWKEDPLDKYINGEWWWMTRLAHESKDVGIVVLVAIQKGVVVASKVMSMIWIVPISCVVQIIHSMKKKSSIGNTYWVLRPYVLHLKGENDLVPTILESYPKDTNTWIDKGKKTQPTALKELIETHSSIEHGFAGIITTLIGSQLQKYDILHCSGLTIVALATIASALPGIDKNSTESLLKSVNEGLKYVRVVETYLCDRELIKFREAADVTFLGDDFFRKYWNGRSLVNDATKEIVEDCISILKTLNHKVGEYVSKFQRRNDFLVAECMQLVSEAMMEDNMKDITNEMLFEWIRKAIAQILWVSLTNLPRGIYMMCFCSPIEEREKVIRDAALLLGEAEELLTMLSNRRCTIKKKYTNSWVNYFRSRLAKFGPTQAHKETRSDS